MAKVLMVPPGVTSTTAPTTASGLNMLMFAPAKHGKTALAVSLVDHESVVRAMHIDIDGSPKTVTPHPKLDRAEVPDGAEGWAYVEKLHKWLSTAQHDYNMVILDTLTTLGSFGLDDVLKQNFLKARRDEGARLAFPSMGDYGINNRRMLRLIRAFRELSVARGWHVIFICHEKTEKDESGLVSRGPALSGSLTEVVPGIPDVLARLVNEQGKRVLQLAPSKGVAADYRRQSSQARTLPPAIQIKDFTQPESGGMTLADIWSAICAEEASAA